MHINVSVQRICAKMLLVFGDLPVSGLRWYLKHEQNVRDTGVKLTLEKSTSEFQGRLISKTISSSAINT